MNDNEELDQAMEDLKVEMDKWNKRISSCVKSISEVQQKLAKKDKQKADKEKN